MAGYTPTRTFTPAQRQAMDRVTHGLPTKSAKMRALEPAGYSRSDIAAYLGTSYQHVRSVLGPRPEEVSGAMTASVEREVEDASWGVLKLDEHGALQLPKSVLAALHAEPGMWLGWTLDGDRITVMGPDAGLKFVQDFARRFVVEGEEPWSDQLIRQRREEVTREEEEERDKRRTRRVADG